MDWLLEQLGSYGMTIGLRLLVAITVFVIGFKIVNFAVKRIKGSKGFSKMDPSASGFITSFISIALKIIVIVTVVGILGVPMSSVVALVASAGVAVGLAVQGALSNLVGGMMILLFKPFRAGDYIDAQGVSGTVREISVFYTVLVTPDNKIVTVPNGGLTNSVVTNYSAEDLRRVDIVFTVSYSNDTASVKATMLEVASRCSKTLNNPKSEAVITNCGDNGIQYSLRVWCDRNDYWEVRFELIEGVRNAFKSAEIDIPLPQMEVRIKNDK